MRVRCGAWYRVRTIWYTRAARSGADARYVVWTPLSRTTGWRTQVLARTVINIRRLTLTVRAFLIESSNQPTQTQPEARPSSQRRFRVFFFFQAEDGIRDLTVTGVQTCALPI